jgi:hypothetical protein
MWAWRWVAANCARAGLDAMKERGDTCPYREQRRPACSSVGVQTVAPWLHNLCPVQASAWTHQLFYICQLLSLCFQSKALHMTVDAPWYVPNTVIRRDLQTQTVTEEIRRYSSQYSARLSAHPNELVVNLIELPDNRRLRTHLPNDLPTGFLV